ncbi:MAG: hypothetical protein WC360_07190 [Opitutales bacterium]|jgi:hypothetical protein
MTLQIMPRVQCYSDFQKKTEINPEFLSADKQGFPQIFEEEKVLIFQPLFHPCLSADKTLLFVLW